MNSREPQSISVFFPAYNDAASLPSLVPQAFRTLQAITGDYEVIVVNDGSRDSTADVLQSLQQTFGPRLKVITHPENRGYGGALRSGFGGATKEWVFYTDGDGQYDVTELSRLVDELGPETGMVNGFKLKRSDPLHRIWIGKIYNQFARTLIRNPLARHRLRFPVDPACSGREYSTDVNQRDHLCRTSPKTGALRLRGEGSRRASLPEAARTVAIFPLEVPVCYPSATDWPVEHSCGQAES